MCFYNKLYQEHRKSEDCLERQIIKKKNIGRNNTKGLCLCLCPFSFGHFIVTPSINDGFS